MHRIYSRVVLSLFLAGCFAADSLADTPIILAGGSVDVVDPSEGPFDPVIEEPLRPLFADSTDPIAGAPSACGSMAMAIAPLAVLMMQSLCSSQRKKPTRAW